MKASFLLTIPAVMLLVTACSDDKAAWEQLPSGPITGADAVVTFNGERSYGLVTLDASSATAGSLDLDNVIPGYPDVEMPVGLTEQADGTFAVKGSTTLATPPAMMPSSRADAAQAIYNLSVEGEITVAGKTRLAVTTLLTPEAQGNLAGEWIPEKMLPVTPQLMAHAPVVVTLGLKGQPQKSAEISAQLSLLLGAMLYQTVGELTFNPDGNLTVGYSTALDIARALSEGVDAAGGKYVSLTDASLSTTSNTAFWYSRGNMVFVSPCIPVISYQLDIAAGKNPNLNDGATEENLKKLIATMGSLGIDTDKMLKLFAQLNAQGIPMGAVSTGESLSLVINKQMIDPVMELIAPALPALDKKLSEFLASPENVAVAQLLAEKVFPALGIKNLQEFAVLWATQVGSFTVTVNLTKK